MRRIAIACLVFLLWAGCRRAGTAKRPEPAPATTKSAVHQAMQQHPEPPWFEEVAAKAGIHFHHSSGHQKRFWMPEVDTGGVGLLDYDHDGLLDIYCVNGGSLNPGSPAPPGNHLYHNLGHWRFEDVTKKAGVAGNGEYGMGVAIGDYNNDGWMDIYVTNLGTNILYRNNGDGTFTDVTRQAGVGNTSWGTSAAFFDYDGDGNLDLYVANYLNWSRQTELNCYSRGGLPDYCSPDNYKAPAMDVLYHNNGDGTFENVTLKAGLDKAYGNGLGVVGADFDHDGKIDIFVANDGMPNQLWMNQGNGTFKDEALLRGCAVNAMGMTEADMGISAVDLFNRGWLDLFVTHLVNEGNRLWINSKGYLTDTVTPKGPGAPSLPYTGFGVVFSDFNNDGILDAYIANGRVKYGDRDWDPKDPYAEPNTLLRGLGNAQFQEVFPRGGTHPSLIATGRGLAVGDLDNDGGLDVVIINKDGPLQVLRNIVPHRGRWILLNVLNRKGCYAINAMLKIETADKTYWRQVLPNESYCSSNSPRVHAGLGQADRVQKIYVRWPNGDQEAFGPFPADHIYTVKEGTGQKVRGAFNY